MASQLRGKTVLKNGDLLKQQQIKRNKHPKMYDYQDDESKHISIDNRNPMLGALETNDSVDSINSENPKVYDQGSRFGVNHNQTPNRMNIRQF